MQYEIPIPHAYIHITRKYTMRSTLFKRYVIGYIQSSFPELKPIRIDTKKMIVVCERRK